MAGLEKNHKFAPCGNAPGSARGNTRANTRGSALRSARENTRGSAMVELCLMAPWIFFLFIGVMDFGYFAYAAIQVESAARVAAMRTSVDAASQSSAIACAAVLPELKFLPNIMTAVTSCNAAPLVVTQNTYCGTNAPASIICSARPTSPNCADCTLGVALNSASSEVVVTYNSPQFIPIPGLLDGKLNLTRKAEMRILVQ